MGVWSTFRTSPPPTPARTLTFVILNICSTTFCKIKSEPPLQTYYQNPKICERQNIILDLKKIDQYLNYIYIYNHETLFT